MLAEPLAVFLILGVSFANAANPGAAASDFQDKLIESCQKNSPNANAAVQEITKEIGEFTQSIQISAATLMATGDKQNFCEERSTLITGLQEVANTIDQCLSSEEKYLKDFVPESLSGLLDLMCESDGKNIDELIAAQLTCMKKMELSGADKKLQGCYSKITPSTEKTITKQELCEDLATAKKCSGNAFAESCPEAESLQTLNADIWDAISHPCSLASCVIANFLMMFLAFLVTKLFT